MLNDTIIVGGGFAGLAAATYLGRARRSVDVLDTGKPRNRFATASHGFLGQDGQNPVTILETAREHLSAYPTVRLRSAEASEVQPHGDGFAVRLANGETIEARTLILAFGLRDVLPAIAGLAERWGKTALHCPYCHGFEFSDRPLGVLYRNEMSVHQARLIAEWGPTTLFLNGAILRPEDAEVLSRRGIAIETEPVEHLEGEGSALSTITLKDGRIHQIAALYVAPESHLGSPLADHLGVQLIDGPLGPIIQTDANKLTSVAGVYAAGDIARVPHSVSWAVADGVTAGTAVHRALVFG
ncbi:MAG: NAD(P)/FAD-dependent oxidoreductase [Proteobacteria bacterium]|nr:NAD(P)/FAD-dependent oxidoreductase [Pseudomonadota bacterium]